MAIRRYLRCADGRAIYTDSVKGWPMFTRMVRRLAEDVFVNALSNGIIFILVSAVGAAVGALFAPHAPTFPWIGDLLFGNAVLFLLGSILWLQPTLRIRMLAFTQRRGGPLALYLVGELAGVLFAAAALRLALAAAPDIWAPPTLPQVADLAGAYAGLLVALAGFIGLRRRRAMRITPDYCHRMLVALDRQREAGRYAIAGSDAHATAGDVRRQCRVLDVLAARKPAEIAPGFALAVGRRGVWYALVEVQRPAGEPGMDFPSDPERRLWFWANALWELGAKAGAWSAAGGPDARGIWAPSPTRVTASSRTRHFGNQLDQLFNGGDGLVTLGRFTTMVIRGQPGAGKSTLALQMCVTLARQGYAALYFSLEEERESLIQSAKTYGWYEPGEFAGDDGAPLQYLGVLHTDFPVHTARRKAAGRAGYVLVSSLGHRAMPLGKRKRHLRRFWGAAGRKGASPPQWPRCTVIDSLEGFANVGLKDGGENRVPRSELLELKNILREHCDLLVFLVEDSGEKKSDSDYVDFVADIVIKLGRTEVDDYTLLSAEVLKARNQRHALGPSQIKLRDSRSTPPPVLRGEQARPGIGTGIVLYPSLHYRLYQSRQLPSFGDYLLSTGLPGLDDLLAASPQAPGIRRQSTTALLGPSGTAKSLLAMNFLIEGMRENTRTLFISLRDHSDITTARNVPQDPDLMRYIRQRDDVTRRYMHQFEWTLAGIASWVRRSSGDPFPRRLPYFFTDPPVAFKEFRDGPRVSAEAEATLAFLLRLAELYQQRGKAVNDSDYAALWHAFLDELARRVPGWSETKQLISVGTLEAPQAHAPQEIILVRREGDDEPYIQWHSPVWMDKSAPGDDLLTVIHQRPGNITPEEFIDLVLRTIGYSPGQQHESPFERVVFDDVSQIAQRFPMLARSRLFLPTLIDAIKANGITALFLADTTTPTDVEANVGLPVIADHVMRATLQGVPEPGQPYQEPWIQVEVLARPSPGREPRRLSISPRGESRPTLTLRPVTET